MARLEKQGAHAAGSYAHQLHGTFGQQLQMFRTRLGAVSAAQTSNRCLTTLLALKFPREDPGIKMPAQCLQLWSRMWAHEGRQLQPAVKMVWKSTVDKFKAMSIGQRHRHIRGPLSAVITYLLETGWEPTHAESWDRKCSAPGEVIEWNFPPKVFSQFTAVNTAKELIE